MTPSANATKVGPSEVTVIREIDAPRELVWKEWTEPERFSQWFGTPPMATPVEKIAMDVRPGGEWRASQVNSEDGTEYVFLGTYRDVTEPERLAFSMENPEDRSDPNTEIVTVTLKDLGGGRTEMTLRQEGHLPEEQYPLLANGYSMFFDRMQEHLRKS